MQEIINLLVHSSAENLNPVKHEKNLKILVDVCNDLLSQIVNYIGPNQKNNNTNMHARIHTHTQSERERECGHRASRNNGV